MSYFLEHDKVSGSGPYILGLAGEALGNRKVVYLANDETWKLADASTAAKLPSVGLTMTAIASGKRGWIFLSGFIGLSTWTWTAGGKLYVSDVTAGEITQTVPSGSTEFIQELGNAETATQIYFSPRLTRGVGGGTYTKEIHISPATVKLPAAQAPAIVIQDNTVMLSFNQNDTESAYFSWKVSNDYAGGDLTIWVHWTNDGGVDDNGKNVTWEINYQTVSDGDVVSGSHANSPKSVNDTYTSAAGWIFHTTPVMTIAEADFSAKMQVEMRVTALAAPATQLTGESHLVALMMCYTAYGTPE